MAPPLKAAIDSWLQEYVRIDPQLTGPFDLGGNQARRLTLVKCLLRELRLEERHWANGAFRPETYVLLYEMLDRLADLRTEQRVHVPTMARAICGAKITDDRWDGIDRISAAAAVLDLGWGHHQVFEDPARDALQQCVRIYMEQMSTKVRRLLEAWAKQGWINDSSAPQVRTGTYS